MSGQHPTGIHKRVTQQIVAAIAAGAGEYQMPGIRKGMVNTPLSSHATGTSLQVSRHQRPLLSRRAREQKGIAQPNGPLTTNGFRLEPKCARERQPPARHSISRLLKRRGNCADATANTRDSALPQSGRSLIIRTAAVFNADKVDGYSVLDTASVPTIERHVLAKELITASGAIIKTGGNKALYLPIQDEIHLPPKRIYISGSVLRRHFS